ncbi:MAG: AI-2E family transporter [Polyangiaceae bacterium]
MAPENDSPEPSSVQPNEEQRRDPTTRSRQRTALSVLALLAAIGAAYVAHPVWMGLMVGTAMAFTSEPLFRWLAPRFRYNRALAALITTLTGGFVSVATLIIVTWVTVTELLDLVSNISVPYADELMTGRFRSTLERAHISPENFITQVNGALVAVSERAAGGLAQVVSAGTSMMLTGIIAFFTMYYVLVEWASMVRRLEHLMPLEPRHTRALLSEFRSVGRSALVGTLGTALVQGILAGIGYTLAGVPQPVLWATVTMFASFLPVVGTAAVWIPVAIARAVSGHSGSAAFVTIWGFIIVTGVADYIVRPRLVGSKGQVHPLPLLVSLLGGVELFGLLGVIVGPILMALCLSVVRIYEQDRTG